MVFGVPGRIALLLAIVALCYFGFVAASDQSPRERERVIHPGGYSMIRPRDWASNVSISRSGTRLDGMEFSPVQWKGLPPKIWVRRLSSAPSSAVTQPDHGYVAVTFQGQAAWQSQTAGKHYMTRTIYFQRRGQWFEAAVTTAGVEAVNLESWWAFVETFEPGNSKMPATRANTTSSSM